MTATDAPARYPGPTLSAATAFVGVALIGILRFTPTGLPAVAAVYWGDAALLGIAAIWFSQVKRLSWTRPVQWIAISGVWLLFFMVMAVLGSATSVGGNIPAAESAIQIIRFVVYGITLLFLADLANRAGVGWERLSWTIVTVAVAVNVAVVTVQLLSPPLISEMVRVLWNDDKLRPLTSGNPRVYGTFFNANWFGVFVAWCLTYVAAVSRAPGVRAWRLATLVAGALLLMIASASRTGILASTAGVAASLAWAPRRTEAPKDAARRSRGLVTVIAAAVIAGVIIVVRRMELTTFAGRFVELGMLLTSPQEAEVATLNARMLAWRNALDVYLTSPLFGVGGSTETSGVAPHNGYIAVLMNFGIVGALALTLFVFGVCLLTLSHLRGDLAGRRLRAWMFGFTTALGVAWLAGDFVYTSRLLFLWFLIVALITAHGGRRNVPVAQGRNAGGPAASGQPAVRAAILNRC